MIESKRRSKKTPRAKKGSDSGTSGASGENVVDLMAALKESLKADKGSTRKTKSTAKKSSTTNKSGSAKKSA